MHLNTTPDLPLAKPCIRDLHELLHQHLSPQLVMLTPLPELERRLHEIAAQHPRFREEAPLVLSGEARRRHRYSGGLGVTGKASQVA
ncbi:hypothetical protein GO988_15410 [Hymenobacter sp. HMF4947]|uniref:Uncharacterized protein n=1 Tax=Hymenobacter ginkgonis TaxID=2682976 RepID=A0A7K1TH28_9BACT|nr:hypothetical protein [Hymenobacter ginkgonis]MVN77720.1 hypothetical protein [Hymenobacter ginkgonis]